MAGSMTSARRWVRDRSALATARLRVSAWSIAQMAVGAGLSWQVASTALGHTAPYFASFAAVVCLGLGAAKRLRRVAELAVGVTVGVAIGEVLVMVIGPGAWQIALVVAVALVIARLLDSGGLIATQSALQAVIVLAVPQQPGGTFARWEDAMIGGATALVITVVAPQDPRHLADLDAGLAVDALVAVLHGTATAIRTRDVSLADDVLILARGTTPVLDRWDEAVSTGEDISRLSPLRRRHRDDLLRLRQVMTGVDRATRNSRVLARRVAASLDEGRALPPGLADILDELAAALAGAGGGLAVGAASELADQLRSVASRLDVVSASGGTWSGVVAVAQTRAIVVDLLTATGVPLREARLSLPDSDKRSPDSDWRSPDSDWRSPDSDWRSPDSAGDG